MKTKIKNKKKIPLLLNNRVPKLRVPRQLIEECLQPLLNKRQLDVVFVTPQVMRRLNRDYHHVDEVTDVLAFSYEPPMLGEIFVCPSVAKKQAQARGLTFTSELVLYVVHGCLHLLGYDDAHERDAQKMRRKEVALLKRVGLRTDRLT